jgi:hypothetical protein
MESSQIPLSTSIPGWQQWYGQNTGNTIFVNGQLRTLGQDIFPDELLSAFRQGAVSWQGATPPTVQMGTGTIGDQVQPEQNALAQMAQIDPVTEALRQQVAASYLGTTTQRAPQMGPPTAGDIQSYLDLYNQIDPTGLAGRQALEQQLTSQAALGSQLDPVTQREIEQSVRTAQAARGNVYGTPQLVQEAMTTGQAGLALQQQRQAALQGFYQSGQDVGNVAQGLYQTGLSNYLARMGNYRAAQQAALGYLGSGQTPYQAGASYLNMAENRAAAAAQGGPVFNPQGQSPYYTGAGTSSFPQYGLDVSQLANQWQQSMNYGQYAGYNAQLAASQSRGGGSAASAGMGAAKGAASGALTGMAAGPWGALIGAGVGALGGAASGYFSG